MKRPKNNSNRDPTAPSRPLSNVRAFIIGIGFWSTKLHESVKIVRKPKIVYTSAKVTKACMRLMNVLDSMHKLRRDPDRHPKP